jgi:Integrase core domain
MCDSCQVRRSIPKPLAGKPIISTGFMTRMQMDLIDMRSVTYGGFNFVFHAKDHFTKYSWLSALPSKEAKYVATELQKIFYTFGPPRILQSDNGKEFV